MALTEEQWELVWDKAAEVATLEKVVAVEGSAWNITSLIDEVVRAVVPLAVELEKETER